MMKIKARMTFVNDSEDSYPDAISDYRLYDYRGDLVPLSSIPVRWNRDERLASYDRAITLNGFVQISHHGRRQSWHQIKAWKFDMSTKDSGVEISVLSEEWIKLKDPSHDYVKFHKSLLVALHTLRFFKSNPQAKWQTFVAHISTIFSSEDFMSCLFEHGLFFREATLRDGALAKSQEKQQQPLQHIQPTHDISKRFIDVLSKIKGAFQKQDYQSFDTMMLLHALIGTDHVNKTTMSSVEGDQDNKHTKAAEETPNKLVLILDDMLKEMRKGDPHFRGNFHHRVRFVFWSAMAAYAMMVGAMLALGLHDKEEKVFRISSCLILFACVSSQVLLTVYNNAVRDPMESPQIRLLKAFWYISAMASPALLYSSVFVPETARGSFRWVVGSACFIVFMAIWFSR